MSTTRAVRMLALTVLCAGVPASAEEPSAPSHATFRRELRNTVGAGVNPLGLQEGIDLSWRRPLFSSASPLLKDAHLSFGVAPRLTPAYARVGVWVELAPLSILELRGGFEPTAYFGSFKSLLYFGGYRERFDEEARRARSGEAVAGLAGRVFLAPTLKLRAGRFVTRSRAEFEWWRAREKGAFFYEPARDTLLKASGDSMMTSETVLAFELRGGSSRRLVGTVHDLTWVYAARANRRQDVGLIGVWGLGASGLGLKEATLVGKLLYYVEDPFKKGQLGAQLSIGFRLGRS